MNYNHIKPGSLEVYCGPMKSGKTREILYKIDKIKYLENCNFLFIKPKLDTRDTFIKSRFSDFSQNCESIDETKPFEILQFITPELDLLIIDEIQFFSNEIVQLIEQLLKKGLHIIVAGLDTDFLGKGFGKVPELMAQANKVYKLSGICEYSGCSNSSTRTQRLIDGKPAKISDPIVSIEGEKNTYQSRCLIHHQIE